MKDSLDDYIRKKWSKAASKLCQPIAKKNALFSQDSAQLVFILLIFIVVSDTSNVVQFSQTLLGRISAVIILLYFTFVHPMVGAIFSMGIILYYHSDLVKSYYYETVLYKDTPSTVREGATSAIHNARVKYDFDEQYYDKVRRRFKKEKELHKIEKQDWKKQKKDYEDYIDVIKNKDKNTESFANMEASRISSAYPFTTDIQTVTSKHSPWFRPTFFNEQQMREGFESKVSAAEPPSTNYSRYRATYDEQETDTTLPYSMRQNEINYFSKEKANEEAEQNALFRQEHCSATGDLMHKGVAVKPSMAEMIFPELHVEGSGNGHTCNPCSSSCKIHVSKIDKRLEAERILQQRNHTSLHKTSNDWVPSWFDIFLPHPVFQQPYEHSQSQPFAKPVNKSMP